MKNDMGFTDESLNLFKLMIYKWDMNQARKYYEKDKFCNDYCIFQNKKDGCVNNEYQCPFDHSTNLIDLIFGGQKKRDYDKAKLLCLYLMSKKVYNNHNAQLFNCFAYLLHKTGNSKVEYLKSEKYYLRALKIDDKYGHAHHNYALLLQHKLRKYDLAEHHFQQSLDISPDNTIRNVNFGSFLWKVQKKYTESLYYCSKACELAPEDSEAFYCKGNVLYELKRYDEARKALRVALELHGHDRRLHDHAVRSAKDKISRVNKRFGVKGCITGGGGSGTPMSNIGVNIVIGSKSSRNRHGLNVNSNSSVGGTGHGVNGSGNGGGKVNGSLANHNNNNNNSNNNLNGNVGGAKSNGKSKRNRRSGKNGKDINTGGAAVSMNGNVKNGNGSVNMNNENFNSMNDVNGGVMVGNTNGLLSGNGVQQQQPQQQQQQQRRLQQLQQLQQLNQKQGGGNGMVSRSDFELKYNELKKENERLQNDNTNLKQVEYYCICTIIANRLLFCLSLHNTGLNNKK